MSKTDELTGNNLGVLFIKEKVNNKRNTCIGLILLSLGNMTRLQEQGGERDKGLLFLVINFLYWY